MTPNRLAYRHRLIINFQLNCTETKLGEAVRVTGSCAELGNWDPTKGMLLQTSTNDFPWWKGQTHIDQAKMVKQNLLEYKYVIVNAPTSSSFGKLF